MSGPTNFEFVLCQDSDCPDKGCYLSWGARDLVFAELVEEAAGEVARVMFVVWEDFC